MSNGEGYPQELRDLERTVNGNSQRLAVLESQRLDAKEDIDHMGDKIRDEMAAVRQEIRNLSEDRKSATLGQKIAYISAVAAVSSSLLIAVAQIVGHG